MFSRSNCCSRCVIVCQASFMLLDETLGIGALSQLRDQGPLDFQCDVVKSMVGFLRCLDRFFRPTFAKRGACSLKHFTLPTAQILVGYRFLRWCERKNLRPSFRPSKNFGPTAKMKRVPESNGVIRISSR